MKARRVPQPSSPPPDLIVLEMTVEEAQQLMANLGNGPYDYWDKYGGRELSAVLAEALR